jgi:hypothetical protein
LNEINEIDGFFENKKKARQFIQRFVSLHIEIQLILEKIISKRIQMIEIQ